MSRRTTPTTCPAMADTDEAQHHAGGMSGTGDAAGTQCTETCGHLAYIVDDDAVVAEMLKELLESRGDRVRVFSNAEDALAAFVEEEPCYAILDQQLPRNARAKSAHVAAGEWLIEQA